MKIEDKNKKINSPDNKLLHELKFLDCFVPNPKDEAESKKENKENKKVITITFYSGKWEELTLT